VSRYLEIASRIGDPVEDSGEWLWVHVERHLYERARELRPVAAPGSSCVGSRIHPALCHAPRPGHQAMAPLNRRNQ